METQKVVLYYPNNWKRYIGGLASPDEKKFNWFLCAKPYKDPKTGLMVAEIGRGTRFYDERTGKTLIVPLLSEEEKGDGSTKILLLISGEKSMKDAIKYGYHGTASLQKCSLGSKASDEFVICKEAEFEFLPGILEDSKKERTCPIIDFSKRNNKCIRSKLPEFPSCEEIDYALETYKCSSVCRVLYEYIYDYLSVL